MSSNTRIATVTRTATLTLALAVPAALLAIECSTAAAAPGCNEARVSTRVGETGACTATAARDSAGQAAAAQRASNPKPATHDAAAEQPTAAGGMRIYVDPQTGTFTAPPEGAALPSQPSTASPSASAASEEGSAAVWNSPVSGGGQMIDTHGQFLHSMRAQTGPAGVVIGCQDDKAAAQTGTER